MEENTSLQEPGSNICSHCTIRSINPTHVTPLCDECREAFIKFPIPVWIKLFGAGVGVILLLALFNLPAQLSTAIHLERGKNAAKSHKFLTAQRELRQALKKVPNSIEGQAYMMISSYYNLDMEEFGKLATKLGSKSIEDQELYSWLDDVAGSASGLYPSDSFIVVMREYDDVLDSIPDTAYEKFLAKHPEEIFASVQYASKIMEEDSTRKARADSLLTHVLSIDKNQIAAIQILSALRREEGDLSGSLQFCEQLIESNQESSYGLSSKARTLLKMKKDKEALALAKSTYDMDNSSGYAQATLCLAYHFNGKLKERDELVKDALKDTAKAGYMDYALDVINNKKTYR